MMIDPQSVVQGLVRRGIPQHIAIGMAGNMAVESGFNPGINEIAPLVPGSRGGFGLNQWTGPRRVQFEQFAQGRGASLDDLDTQLDFTLWELQNTERNAFNALMQAQDPIQAAQIYSDKFLRPGIPHMDRRLAETRRLAGMPVETISTQGGGNSAGGGGQGLLMDQQPKTKFQELRDKGFFDNAAMAFNSLRHRPDPNIAQIGMMRQQERREAGTTSRTAQWLRANGREDLASAVEAGLDPKAALGAALQPQERGYQTLTGKQLIEQYGLEPGAIEPNALYNLSGQGQITKVGGSGTTVNVGGPGSPGWEAVDKEFAKTWIEWTQGGGADTMKQIAQLRGVMDRLAAGEELTGPQFGLQPDALQSLFNPEALSARQQVEEVVQRNLRVILGAQFTEKEGERLISRAYDQRLTPQQNAARLATLVQQMEAAAAAKASMAEYFGQNGTLQGFEASGVVPTIADFDATLDALDRQMGIDTRGGESPAGGMPKPGDIVDGHRFKGGDPAAQSNWEKI